MLENLKILTTGSNFYRGQRERTTVFVSYYHPLFKIKTVKQGQNTANEVSL